MRCLPFAALLVGFILAAASPAHADWDKTRWGMTPDEAKAAYPAAVALAPDLLRVNGSFTLAGASFPAIGLGFNGEGRLSAVLFVPVPEDILKLQIDLSLAFGEGRFGVFTNVDGGRQIVVAFADPAHANSLTLTWPVAPNGPRPTLMLLAPGNTPGAPEGPGRQAWQCAHGMISAACGPPH